MKSFLGWAAPRLMSVQYKNAHHDSPPANSVARLLRARGSLPQGWPGPLPVAPGSGLGGGVPDQVPGGVPGVPGILVQVR